MIFSLYDKYEVKRGLRDLNGKGVLTGLTEISEVKASEVDENGVSHPCDGKLYYRGHDVEKLIEGFTKDKRFGFEEVTYLLLFGELPDKKQLADFNELLGNYRCIPPNFVRDIIMKKPSRDIMNAVARSVLMLYAYDDKGRRYQCAECCQTVITADFRNCRFWQYTAIRHTGISCGRQSDYPRTGPEAFNCGKYSAFIKGRRQIYTVRSRDSGYCTGTACRTRRR